MTPRESHSFDAHALAEKIVIALSIDDEQHSELTIPIRNKAITLVESLLAEAMEEVRKEEQTEWEEANTELVKEAKAAAYEDAAKIVEQKAVLLRDAANATSLVLDKAEKEAFAECVERLAATIRQRAKEIK